MNSRELPLVVDLDGTLVETDTLIESLCQFIRQSPSKLLNLPFWLLEGRARFKASIAMNTRILPELLPYRAPLLQYVRDEKARGRRIVLATAAHESIAERVATHLDVFETVLASDETRNLKGTTKLAAIHDAVGTEFVYAGDSAADLPVWEQATAAVLVAAPPRTAAQVRAGRPIEREFPAKAVELHTWLKALRVHQWLKNLLVFVPLLTGFAFDDMSNVVAITIAFLAFCCAASATYILNDLLDMASDRTHPRKRLRPFASAALPIPYGLAAAAIALALAGALGLAVSPIFLLVIVVYLGLSTTYSLALKKYVLFDVLLLSVFYTLRILAGAVAISVPMSSWLLAFSMFMFLSLALVKRCSELKSLEQIGVFATSGRDYRVTDLVVLWPLGVGAALSAVVVFGLFISAAETQARYATPDLLWFVAVGLVYWFGRLWIKTARGEMHDDPLIYAIKDRGSFMTVAGMALFALAAHVLTIGVMQ